MAKNNQWLDWLRCNVLEIITLILVLLLVINVYGCTPTPIVGEEAVPAEEVVKEAPAEGAPAGEGAAPETPLEEAPAAEEQPLAEETATEPAAEETLTE